MLILRGMTFNDHCCNTSFLTALLSRVVYWATRWTFGPWKNWLISTIVRNYQVNMAEARAARCRWPISTSMPSLRASCGPMRALQTPTRLDTALPGRRPHQPVR